MFWVVMGLFLGGVTMDVGSTLYVMDRCPTCYETNVLAKPFVQSPAILIPVATIGASGVFLGSRKLKQHSKWWFVIPVALTIRQVMAARHNLRLLEGEPK